MKNRGIRLIGVLLVLGITASVAGPRVWYWWTAPPAGYCPICRRHEHRDSLVKLQAEGEGVIETCCLSCAFSYGRQTAKAVTIVSVTDHETGQPLDPEKATFVVGSDVSPCTHATEPLRTEQAAVPVLWDRCLPSILALASRESAEAFQAQHGGRLRSLQEVRADTATSRAPPD